MPSIVGGKRNVKVFILYLMQNVGIPVSFTTLNDMIMQTDYVMYLDFSECFYELLDDGLIVASEGDEGPVMYSVTAKGKLVAEQLHTDILPKILDESLACALRYLDFKQRGIRTRCEVTTRSSDGAIEFTCIVEQNGKPLLRTVMTVDSEVRARQMEENFRARPEAIYKGMWSLLTGKVNYLFD